METVSTPSLIAITGIALILTGIYASSVAAWNKRSRGLPLPPGPKPIPLIGNIRDFPKTKQGPALRDMCARYGDVLYFNLLGQHTVVLGSHDAIIELLEKRSTNTVDRLANPLVDFLGMASFISLSRYGKTWKRHRRQFWLYFKPDALFAYQPGQRYSAHKFLLKILQTPSRLKEHIRFSFSAVMLEIFFGHKVSGEGDEFITLVDNALDWLGEAFVPGKFLIETLPIIRDIPSWFPGATAKRMFVHWKSTIVRLREDPYQRVKAAMARNEESKCVVSQMITSLAEHGSGLESEDDIKDFSTMTIEAAADTMFTTLQIFFLAMALNPEVQKKAQAELDAVVGPRRLPDFTDQESLPYVNATIREIFRWKVVVPLAIQHVSIKDDEFRGYFLPAGTAIVPNVWACTQDANLYNDPDVFRPERFIRDGKLDFTTAPDPNSFIFGFGKRMCPGRYFAEKELFIKVASVLHTFNITPPEDENGNPIALSEDMTNGFIRYPVDCRCTIKPRSPDAEAHIREAHANQGVSN